jgi:histidine triad (HIT) family protein
MGVKKFIQNDSSYILILIVWCAIMYLRNNERKFKMDCIFCKIINGEIPSNKVYEDDMILAFHDINPEAPVHIIIIPKKHIGSAAEITEDNSVYVAHIFEKIPAIAAKAGLDNGFRVITNCGADGGQSVPHLHFHLLGGTALPLHLA